MTQPKLAAQVYTIRDFIKTVPDFAASMARVAALGYAGVQLDLEHHPDVPPADIRRICDDHGLAICITHFDYDYFQENFDDVVTRQTIWGCAHTAIVAMPRRFHAQGRAGYAQFTADATQLGERLAQAGISLSYHNHSFEFVRFDDQTGLDVIFAESDPRLLQAEIDTYWVQHGGGDPAVWIARMAGRMPVVHYKDMVILEDGSQAFAEVGQGNLNWKSIHAATLAAGIPWIVVEQDKCRRDPFESLALSIRFLHKQFASDGSAA